MESLENAADQLDTLSARSVRDSMRESGFNITPHPAFASLALHIHATRLADDLVESDITPSTLDISDVLEWWALAPNAHDCDLSFEATQLCEYLLSDRISVSDCQRGGILIAQKGYAHHVKSLIPRVIRFSTTDESNLFIAQINQADVAMWGHGEKKRGMELDPVEYDESAIPWVAMYGVNVQGNTRRRIASRFNLAIRTHAFYGRPTTAYALLLDMVRTIPNHVRLFTYLVILETLSSPQYAADFQEVKSLAQRTLKEQDFPLLEYLLRHSYSQTAAAPRTFPSRDFRSTLLALRSAAHFDRPLPPIPILAAWIQECHENGRERVMHLLRKRWFRLSRRGTSLTKRSRRWEVVWAEAELHRARQRRDPIMAMKVFSAYFEREGVPGFGLMRRTLTNAGRAGGRGVDLDLRDGAFLDPKLGMNRRRKDMYGPKLSPPIQAVTMLLETLLNPFPHKLATSNSLRLDSSSKTMELYLDMLKFFEQEIAPPAAPSQTSSEPSSTTSPSKVPFISPPSLRPDAVLFQVFLSSRLFRSATGVSRILGDMRQFGVEMTRQNWTAILHTLATEGKEDVVLDLLRMMEPGPSSQLASKDDGSRSTQLPEADAITYVAAIQGFLLNARVSMAENVLKRLQSRSLDMNEQTNEVVAYLQRKIADGRRLIGRSGIA